MTNVELNTLEKMMERDYLSTGPVGRSHVIVSRETLKQLIDAHRRLNKLFNVRWPDHQGELKRFPSELDLK